MKLKDYAHYLSLDLQCVAVNPLHGVERIVTLSFSLNPFLKTPSPESITWS